MGFREGDFGAENVSRGTLLVRALAVASALYLTIGFGWLVLEQGVTPGGLVLAVLSLGFAWGGVVGTTLDRPSLPLVGALALFLLGFWQAVLWIFMLPAALGLAVTAVIVAHAV